MKYIAFTVKGLEAIAVDELKNCLPDVEILECVDKQIIFSTDVLIKELLVLSTIDDICLSIGKLEGLPKDNTACKEIGKFLVNINWQKYVAFLRELRAVETAKFSLTIATLKTKYSSNVAIEKISTYVSQKLNWKYCSRDHTNLDIRVIINKNVAIIGVRIFRESLHHRRYKTAAKAGSLRPTIAAAMLWLVTRRKSSQHIVDNFCGSGTILCEALLKGNKIAGGDIDKESVQNTVKNLNNIKEGDYNIKCLDARRTDWKAKSFDCAISNLPWGKQIEVERMTTLYADVIREYHRILKPSGEICLLGMKPDFLVSQIRKIFGYENIRTYRLGYIGQNPYIILGASN